MNTEFFSEKQIQLTKYERTLEEESAITLLAIKIGHVVAFGKAQPGKTNLRNPYERVNAGQLTIKAIEPKTYKINNA